MAEEISEERFKDEMMDMMKAAILKIGENTEEIALLRRILIKTR